MPTKREQIISKALEILDKNPEGVRFSQLVNKVSTELPGINVNTIWGSVWDLDKTHSKEVIKPARGLFQLISHASIDTTSATVRAVQPRAKSTGPDEAAFYEPFSQYLLRDLEEVNNALILGGAYLRDYWATPDVIGTFTSGRGNILEFPPEITSVEVKISTSAQDLMVGFSQACSYLLFSHKSYLVIPKKSSQDSLDRLDALCRLFGIGLVVFDGNDDKNPKWEIKTRAIKHEPDSYYVNFYLGKLSEKQITDLKL